MQRYYSPLFGFSLLPASLLLFLSHQCRSFLSEFSTLERETQTFSRERERRGSRVHTLSHQTTMASLDIFLFSLSTTFCTPFAVYIQIQVFHFSLFFFFFSINHRSLFRVISFPFDSSTYFFSLFLLEIQLNSYFFFFPLYIQ